jgi:hypothetical protein
MQQIDNQFFNRRAGTAILVGVLCLGLMVGLVIFFSKIYPIGFSCAAAESWVGPAEGTWETAENWSCGRVPTATDDVVLSTSTGYIIVTLSSGQTANFRTLTVGGGGGFASLYLVGNIGSGQDITVDAFGTIEQRNKLTQHISGALTIKESGSMTHAGNGREHVYSLDFSADSIDIQAGSYISVNGKGYSGDGAGPGGGATGISAESGQFISSGGAHGGKGGSRESVLGGTAYCDVTNITTLGSAGGYAEESIFNGAGGGYVSLRSQTTTTISGVISAEGAPGTLNGDKPVGGGAGGGIRVISNGAIVTNNPNISANGVSGFGELSAGGGGGCVSFLYHTTSTILNLQPLITVTRGHHSAVDLFPEDGLFYAAQFNTTPTTTIGVPVQTSTAEVSFSVSVTDNELDSATLVVEHSFDGVVWSSSTLKEVTPSQGTVATSTGSIMHVGGASPTTTLDVVWNIAQDVPPANVSEAYLRVVSSDASARGGFATSGPFSIVIAPPSGLTLQNITADTATLSWTGDAVFSVYELDEETDANSSGWVSSTEYALTSLTCGTRYVFYVRGRSSGGFQSGYSDSVTATTLPCPAVGSSPNPKNT